MVPVTVPHDHDMSWMYEPMSDVSKRFPGLSGALLLAKIMALYKASHSLMAKHIYFYLLKIHIEQILRYHCQPLAL